MLTLAPNDSRNPMLVRVLARLFPCTVARIEAAAVAEAIEIRRGCGIPGLGDTLLRERFGLC